MAEAEIRPRVVLVTRSFVLNDQGEMLLIQRSKFDTHSPTKWEVPGGKLDEGKDLGHALEDEVMEETGLVVNPASQLRYVDSFTISGGKYNGLPYVIIFGVSRLQAGEVVLSEEHDDFKWLKPEDALKYDLTPEVRKALVVLKDTF